jgi:hypothetical protein
MDIKEIKEKVERNEYEISFHAEKERYAENITFTDLENAIYNGEILEDYPDDVRGPSCLLLGHSQNRPIHIVCGYTPINWIRIITVYIFNPKGQSGLMKGEEVKEVREMHNYGDCSFCVCQQCGEKYLTAKVAKEIEQRILTKEKWDKTISVPVDVFPEEIAV